MRGERDLEIGLSRQSPSGEDLSSSLEKDTAGSNTTGKGHGLWVIGYGYGYDSQSQLTLTALR